MFTVEYAAKTRETSLELAEVRKRKEGTWTSSFMFDPDVVRGEVYTTEYRDGDGGGELGRGGGGLGLDGGRLGLGGEGGGGEGDGGGGEGSGGEGDGGGGSGAANGGGGRQQSE